MNATARSRSTAPYFTATIDTDVDIDPEDLEAAGWVYVGSQTKPEPVSKLLAERIERWHDENHAGAWPWCVDEFCRDIRAISEATA